MRSDDEREYVEYVSARLAALHRTAFVLCGDAHRADDIVQTTITDLYRKWRHVRLADNVDAYVHRMLVRKHLDEQRRGLRRIGPMSAVPERAEPPPTGVEDREILRGPLARLSNVQRTVLILRFVCDLSVEDVARELRCSASNVKSHTARGLETLRHLMRDAVPNGANNDLR
jgi:RNA polymerase sigma-70 factor (sigma-E family)